MIKRVFALIMPVAIILVFAATARAQDDDRLRDLGHLGPPSHDPCLGHPGSCNRLHQLSRSGEHTYAPDPGF